MQLTELQKQHPIVVSKEFDRIESYVLYLIHRKAYEEASKHVEGKIALDWGCNDGYGMEILRPHARQIYGLDVAPHAIELAKKRLGINEELILYDGKYLPASLNGKFDVVTSFQLIEHLDDYTNFFCDVNRALRKGGKAIFTTPNARIRLCPGMKPWNQFHVREFTVQDLKAELKKWFSSVEIWGLFGAKALLDIEMKRVDANRRRSAKQAKSRSLVQNTLSLLVSGMTSKIWPRQSNVSDKERMGEFIKRFSTADLWYLSQFDEEPVDLMAICH